MSVPLRIKQVASTHLVTVLQKVCGLLQPDVDLATPKIIPTTIFCTMWRMISTSKRFVSPSWKSTGLLMGISTEMVIYNRDVAHWPAHDGFQRGELSAACTSCSNEVASYKKIWNHAWNSTGICIRAEYSKIGILVANVWSSSTAAVHLYNALQSEKLLPQNLMWPDLDVVAEILGEDSFFVGGKSSFGMVDCFKKACLQLGASVSAVAGLRRSQTIGSLHSAAGPRGIKADLGSVTNVFVERYSWKMVSLLWFLVMSLS
ncbi:hypothetical protein GMORB2_4923 [Geosmithia morbida]|uniref:Uncharacterized protein n=1 Tax=Geosmithia morbida TaxID=1094350 RepID=A0A9P5D2D5_9HYPO|nr:uncharacterized protein GMORB2_4923 [Geosmithia morbida]KAF4119404.1 hypothetical protein GMORB2_4923 [Geosmithia morbida]